MKILTFIKGLIASTLLASSALAQEQPKWIRHTALSPDGSVIAFTYQGDIFTIPIQGGKATQLTTHAAYDTAPVWSPDGKQIAFASDREGSFDVYLMAREGGKATRLTFNSADERPVTFDTDGSIIYEASLRPSSTSTLFPSPMFSQLYSVTPQGGRPRLYSSWTMKEPSLRGTQVLYTDLKGYEDQFRKRHTSSVTRDIWLYTPEKGHRKLTTYKGEDRNALWVPGEEAFVYLSEQKGSFNIFKQPIAGGTPVQLTQHTQHPVRYMSSDSKGNLAYSFNGELYYLAKGGSTTKVNVQIYSDNAPLAADIRTLTSGATDFALSPDNKEVAFVLRGDVYVTSVEYDTTKRITNTPQQERNVAFSPDGRKLLYSSERKGKWDLFMSTPQRSSDKSFTYAHELKETQLTDNAAPSFEGKWSPDGKEIAFLRDRSGIFVLNLATKQEREVMNKRYNYSYQDGDQWFQWSPDGKWIVTDYIGIGGWNNKDVAVIAADGSGKTINLTESGYNEGHAKWVLGGKAIAFFSDRAGYRSHGSWGSESDLYLMFLDKEAFRDFSYNKEEREMLLGVTGDEEEDEEGDDEQKKSPKLQSKRSKKAADDAKAKAAKAPKALKLDFTNLDERTIRITRTSSSQSDFVMDSKGKKFYYIAESDNQSNLYVVDLAEKSTRVLATNVGMGDMQLGKDDATLYINSRRGMQKWVGGKPTPITFSAEFEHKRPEEMRYIFDHAVQQVRDKFYDPSLHGIDWDMYAANYRAILPHINNNYDFADLLSELLGELNASHTGASYRSYSRAVGTASLGLFYDNSHTGDGLKVLEVMVGGPVDVANIPLQPGDLIEKIDQTTILAKEPIETYLNGKVDKRVTITVRHKGSAKSKEYTLRTTSQGAESQLLYNRWVTRNEKMVAEWSQGKIAYIHIEGMDSDSFRKTFKNLLGKYRHCDAVVIDTRFNGGGWLHEDLVILLTGKEYSRFTPRGTFIGSDPFAQWTKPSAVLMGEGNYSNAHGFPFVYKEMKIGKLIGAPVPGTMTAVWWERQVDPSIVFGIPQVTCTDIHGNVLENRQLTPDIEIYNTPEEYLSGHDAQLKRAVEELLAQTRK